MTPQTLAPSLHTGFMYVCMHAYIHTGFYDQWRAVGHQGSAGGASPSAHGAVCRDVRGFQSTFCLDCCTYCCVPSPKSIIAPWISYSPISFILNTFWSRNDRAVPVVLPVHEMPVYSSNVHVRCFEPSLRPVQLYAPYAVSRMIVMHPVLRSAACKSGVPSSIRALVSSA